MEVSYYDGRRLQLSAPLSPNINDKFTAFGGSLYCLAVMSCWGMVYLQTEAAEVDCNLVVSRGEIDYLRPVSEQVFSAVCDIEEGDFEMFLADFKQKGKAKITLSSTILAEGKVAVSFKGEYAILPPVVLREKN